MRYKIFGRRTGLRVSELVLGAGNFGTRWGHGAERTEATKVFDAYVEEVGASPTEVAIAWLLHKARASTSTLIPILGSRMREQLDATLGAVDVKLSLDQIARLDTSTEIPLGTPHEQINSSAPAIAGGKPELLDGPSIPVT